MTKTAPFISVVIPAYNEENYLGDCLKSLLNQSLKPSEYEIIVIDNHSTDKTAQIARQFKVKLATELRRSVVLARQKGVDKSQGEIIVSADADTFYPSDYLQTIKNTFRDNSKVIAASGWLYFYDSSPFYNISHALTQQFNYFLFRKTGKFPLVFAANLAFRKDALAKIGGYPTYLPELGDQQYLIFNFQKIGKVIINKKMRCFTSARRHKVSKGENVFIYNGFYRIIGFVVNTLFRKQVIGPAPAVREERR